jgi:DNA-binding response OmpR family regulator
MAYIMIIDDDEDYADSLITVLTKAGHELAACQDPEAAVAEMEKRIPDLAILDVMFPENKSAGFDLARAIKENPKLKNLPLLMLTGVNQAYKFGFSGQDIDHDWLQLPAPRPFDRRRAAPPS